MRVTEEETTMWCSAVGGIVTLTLSMLVVPLVTAAQPAGKVYRIGWLSPGFPRPDRDPLVDAFRQGLHELGYVEGQYVEGQNVVIEYRGAEGKEERLSDLAAELVRLHVDV